MTDEERHALKKTLRWFTKTMDQKLQANMHKGGYLNCNNEHLFNSLLKELAELHEVLFDLDPGWTVGSKVAIIQEAADIANFAMMIADKAAKDIVL